MSAASQLTNGLITEPFQTGASKSNEHSQYHYSNTRGFTTATQFWQVFHELLSSHLRLLFFWHQYLRKYCSDNNSSRFHPNRFTFDGVIAERIKLPRKVNPTFGQSIALSRIITEPKQPSLKQSSPGRRSIR